MVALTTQLEPTFPGVKVVPEIEHVPETTVKVTAPLPEPPDDVNVNGRPYVAFVDVTVTAACVAFAVEIDVAPEETAL